MKTNAIVRIIVFSVLLICLTGVLLTGLGVGSYLVTDQIDVQTSSAHEFDPSQIRGIEIEWPADSVEVITASVQCITVEQLHAETNNDAYVQVVNGVLKIKESNSDSFIHFGSVSGNEQLTVTVPVGFKVGNLDIETASADINITGIAAEELELESASGNINYEGQAANASLNNASGHVNIVLFNTPLAIEAETASGNIDITLPAASNFTAEVSTAIGKFESEIPTTKVRNTYVAGLGSCRMELESASGNIRIHKGQ